MQKAFQNFNSTAKERNGAIGGARVGWFTKFFWIGTIMACFQMAGILQGLSERL